MSELAKTLRLVFAIFSRALLVVASLTFFTTSGWADEGAKAVAVKGTPTIDGEVDAIWKGAEPVSVARRRYE